MESRMKAKSQRNQREKLNLPSQVETAAIMSETEDNSNEEVVQLREKNQERDEMMFEQSFVEGDQLVKLGINENENEFPEASDDESEIDEPSSQAKSSNNNATQYIEKEKHDNRKETETRSDSESHSDECAEVTDTPNRKT